MSNVLITPDDMERISRQMEISQQTLDSLYATCKRSLHILPLRFSAIYAEAEDAAALAAVPEFKGGLASSPGLASAKYAARFLREGYLYVLVKRLGRYRWEHCYHVGPEALLSPLDINDPKPASGGIPYFTVQDVEDVSEAFMLFHPDPLSPRVLRYIHQLSHWREKLQRFDLASMAYSCVGTDVIEPGQLSSQVAEYIGYKDADVARLLQEQTFPSLTDPFDENAEPIDFAQYRMRFENTLRSLSDGKGVAVVLNDAIGITQELNNFRNNALEPLRAWMEAKEEGKPTNEQKFYCAEMIRNLDEAYVDGKVNGLAEVEVKRYRLSIGMRYLPFVQAVERAKSSGGAQALPIDYEMAEEYESRQQEIFDSARVRIKAQRADEYRREYNKKYAPLLDQQARRRFDAEMDEMSQAYERKFEARSSDHLWWVQSTAFLDALDFYDSRDLIWGWAYAIQVTMAMVGMDGSTDGAALLSRWWLDVNMTDRGNLAWSVYCLNQEEMRSKARQDIESFRSRDQADAGPDDQSWLGQNSMLVADSFKQLSLAFIAANSVIGGATPEWFKNSRLGITMTWYTQFVRMFFEKGGLERIERSLIRIVLGLKVASMGEGAGRLNIKNLIFNRTQRDANKLYNNSFYTTQEIDDAIGRNSNNFLNARMAAILGISELILLYNILSREEKGSRDYFQAATSATLLLAAIADTAAAYQCAVISIRRYLSAAVPDISSYRLGGFSFWGGTLASVGALFCAVDDVLMAVSFSKKKNSTILFAAYAARALANFGVAVLGLTLTLASSVGFLTLVSTEAKSVLLRNVAARLLPLAKYLARLSARYALAAVYSVFIWATVVISIGLWFISDDALESWCKRCSFAAQDDIDYFDDFEEEVDGFYTALQEVT